MRYDQSQARLAFLQRQNASCHGTGSKHRGGGVAAQGFAQKLEGYDAADLRALVERALHEALMRRLASRPRPTGASLCFKLVRL